MLRLDPTLISNPYRRTERKQHPEMQKKLVLYPRVSVLSVKLRTYSAARKAHSRSLCPASHLNASEQIGRSTKKFCKLHSLVHTQLEKQQLPPGV